MIGSLDGMLIGGGFIIRFDKEVAPGYGPPTPAATQPSLNRFWQSLPGLLENGAARHSAGGTSKARPSERKSALNDWAGSRPWLTRRLRRAIMTSRVSRRSLTATFYRPGSVSTMWPPGDNTPLHSYPDNLLTRWRNKLTRRG
jgi:hypothetical protein